ncbi:hypothetical protein IC582_006249 [Cucumis melo]
MEKGMCLIFTIFSVFFFFFGLNHFFMEPIWKENENYNTVFLLHFAVLIVWWVS